MLKIKAPGYRFCPFCGKKLQVKIQEGKRRKFCRSCHWIYYPHVASGAAAVIVKKGKVLMVKRGQEPFKNTWSFPAGYTDFGEHPLEALSREVKEETGLDVRKANFLKVIQAQDDPREPGHFVFFYKVTASGSDLRVDGEENVAMAWFDIKSPPKIGWESHQQIMRLLQKQRD